MQATGIAEALDVSEQIPLRLVTGSLNAVWDTLGFEAVEEALHRGIGAAVTPAAHRRVMPDRARAERKAGRHIGRIQTSSQRFKSGGGPWISRSDVRIGAHGHNCGRRGGRRLPTGMSVQCSGAMLRPG